MIILLERINRKADIPMKINFKKNRGGYDPTLAKQFIDPDKPIQSVSSELETRYVWDDTIHQYTDKVKDYRAWFIQEGLPPFQVAFPKKISIPEYLQPVEFKNLTALKYRNNVYFRADDLKVVK